MSKVGRFCPLILLSPPYLSGHFFWYLLFTTFSFGTVLVFALSQVKSYNTIQNNTMSVNLASIPAITFSSINCSSLNMSTLFSSHHKLKLYGITKLKADFIFLSDIRLGSKSLVGNSIAILERTFLVNPYCAYTLYANSSRSSRGVGILVKKSLSISVMAEA